MASRRRSESSDKRQPIRDAIANRAYELYLERGKVDGHADEDWLAAERELEAAARKALPARAQSH
jgi:hypothetical protein